MKLKLLAAAVLTMASTAVHAATLDFSVFSLGSQGTNVLVLPEATITGSGSDLFIGAAGIDHELCAINLGSCEADLDVDFTGLVSNLSFVTSGYDSGDSVTASIFDAANALIASIIVTSNTLVDFTAYSGISRLFLDDNSTGAGYGYDGFRFDVAQVPLPATLPLLLAGLGAFGIARRRKA